MRTNTFDDIDRLFDRMNRVAGFDGALSDRMGDSLRSGDTRIDVADHGDELVVSADLPGFEREEIELSVDEDRLHIAASHEAESTDEEAQYVRKERANRSVKRSISLPVTVDAESATASYTNGVLTVTLPKRSGDDGHRIDID